MNSDCIQVGLAADYCPSWDVWSAAREVLQNALDSQDDGFEMEIKQEGSRLIVSNKGAKLARKAWLMGCSTKRSGQRGQFGEGLKLAALAATRDSRRFTLINDDEVWAASLQPFGGDGPDVLTMVRGPHAPTGSLTVIIDDLTEWEQAMIRRGFLALSPPQASLKTEDTDILDTTHAGDLYVKGIFVAHDPKLGYGYDMRDVSVDRDRKMVDHSQARVARGDAWDEAVAADEALLDTHLIPMLISSSTEDLVALPICITVPNAEKIADHFKAKYGEDALAVKTQAEAVEVGHFGRRGVVLPAIYVKVLEKTVGTLQQHQASYHTAVERVFEAEDLTTEEGEALVEALALVEVAVAHCRLEPITPRLEVVAFKKPTLNGLHLKPNTPGTIQISRRLLSDSKELRRVLVHEASHDVGLDGEKAHELMEGRLHSELEQFLIDALIVAEDSSLDDLIDDDLFDEDTLDLYPQDQE